MSWTVPRTWVYNELPSETVFNTHVRDNLLFLKSNPLISEVTIATNTTIASTTTSVLTTGSVAIPADVGAVYCEAWGHWASGTHGGGHNNAAVSITETTALEVARNQMYDYSFAAFYGEVPSSGGGPYPFYLRSRDLAWAGTSRTVSLQFIATNWTIYAAAQTISGTGQNAWAQPIVLRIVRSY